MAIFEITIEDTGEVYRCAADESLLCGMERLGKRGIPVGCRGGGCGVCKVRIGQGAYQKRVMSRAHITADEEGAGIVLACRVQPLSDLRLRVLGGLKQPLGTPAGRAVADGVGSGNGNRFNAL